MSKVMEKVLKPFGKMATDMAENMSTDIWDKSGLHITRVNKGDRGTMYEFLTYENYLHDEVCLTKETVKELIVVLKNEIEKEEIK